MDWNFTSVEDFEVGRVIDGDTFEVNFLHGENVLCQHLSVRCRGIQCPEIRTKDLHEKALGMKAKTFLEGILTSTVVLRLDNTERGKYYRLIADVICDGHSMKRLMLKSGNAVPYKVGQVKHDWSKTEL